MIIIKFNSQEKLFEEKKKSTYTDTQSCVQDACTHSLCCPSIYVSMKIQENVNTKGEEI